MPAPDPPAGPLVAPPFRGYAPAMAEGRGSEGRVKRAAIERRRAIAFEV
jgi:hypothetical protein